MQLAVQIGGSDTKWLGPRSRRADTLPAPPRQTNPYSSAGFTGRPLSDRVTLPTKGRYADACFDGFLVRGVQNFSSKPICIRALELVARRLREGVGCQ